MEQFFPDLIIGAISEFLDDVERCYMGLLNKESLAVTDWNRMYERLVGRVQLDMKSGLPAIVSLVLGKRLKGVPRPYYLSTRDFGEVYNGEILDHEYTHFDGNHITMIKEDGQAIYWDGKICELDIQDGIKVDSTYFMSLILGKTGQLYIHEYREEEDDYGVWDRVMDNIVDISCNPFFAMLLKADGQVMISNLYHRYLADGWFQVCGISGAVSVSACYGHLMILDDWGKVWKCNQLDSDNDDVPKFVLFRQDRRIVDLRSHKKHTVLIYADESEVYVQ